MSGAVDGDGVKAGWLDLLRAGRAVFTGLLNLAVILHGVHTFVLATVMPSVIADIGGAAYYAWPAMVYMTGTIIGAASGAPVRAAFGRRRGYVLSGLIFIAGSAAGAAAPSIAVLLAGQMIQGLGGGLLLSQSMALVRELYEGPLRARILALINTAWVAAALIGPAGAGFFAGAGWWRGAFWAVIPFAALVCGLAWRYVPASEPPAVRPGIPARRLALLAAGVFCVGGAGQIDSIAPAAVLVLAAGVLIWGTLRLDSAVDADNALFPKRPLSMSSPVGATYWIFISVALTQIAPSIFLPLLLGGLHGVAMLWVGYYNMLMSCAWSVGSIAAAYVTGRSRTRLAMVAGSVLSLAGLVGIAVGVGQAGLVWHGAMTLLVGLGIGIVNVLAITWIMTIPASGEESLTASAIPALRSLGLAFGAAAVGLIANAGGLGEATDPQAIAGALKWVFGLCALAPAAGLVMVYRAFALAGRPAA